MKKAWIYFSVTFAINIILRVVSRSFVDFSEFYAIKIYPVITGITAQITGIFPFSVIEVFLILLSFAAVFGIIFIVIKIVRNKGCRKRIVHKFIAITLCGISTILIIFCLGCEINYQRRPFSYYSGLSLSRYSPEMLLATVNDLISELEIICENIETDENGLFIMDEKKLSVVSREAMEKLGGIYSCLDTYYPKPKPVFLSRYLLSPIMVCGVFSPFTIEANYNKDMPIAEKPFTICHELSHLNGFMREDEANFIAFLACRESGDYDFLFSGYTSALIYTINAYYSVATNEEYSEMYRRIPEAVRKEFIKSNNYWSPFRDTKVSKAANTVNDTYLKANSQVEGTRSYGRFVDLLIADFNSRNSQ